MKVFSEHEAIGAGDASQVELDLARVKLNLGSAKSVVAFASARGGVGKSAIIANVAAVLALKGRKIGLLDADLNSPSVAAMLGMWRTRLYPTGEGIDPAAGPLGLRVVASNLLVESEPPPLSLVEEEMPVTGNGAGPVELTRAQMLRRLFGHTRFGPLDFLLVDMAPGIGEIDLVARNAPLTGVVLVTHPSELGVQATKCAVEAAQRFGARVVGIIENMAGFHCENCHSVRPLLPTADMSGLLSGKGLTLLGRLAFDPRLAEACDHGALFVKEYADSPLAKQLSELTARLEELLGQASRVVQTSGRP